MWYEFLRKHQISFTRQKPIAQYIVDFYCHSKMLVIEVDGKQHDTVDGREYDSERTKLLESLGVYVLRFANEEVDKSFAQVCKTIQNALDTRETLFHPRPLL